MNIYGWIQLAAVHRRSLCRHPTHGPLPCPGPRPRREDVAGPAPQTGRKASLPAPRRGSGEGAELETLYDLPPGLQPRRLPVHLRHPPPAAHPSPEPSKAGAGRPGSRLQHGREFHDQHQLAELRRRDDAVVFFSDGRAGVPPVWVGGDGHRRRRRARPRDRPAGGQDGRQLLGRPGPDLSLSPPARQPCLFALLEQSRRDPELQARQAGDDPGKKRGPGGDERGLDPDDPPGAGRLANRHQNAGHERRRILQCQRRSSV